MIFHQSFNNSTGSLKEEKTNWKNNGNSGQKKDIDWISKK